MPLFVKKNKAPLGIYIHIPFCRSKCHYCDFYSLPCKKIDEELSDRYIKALCTHIEEYGKLSPNYKVDTVYFGGGTPSFFGSAGLSTILAAVRKSFDVDVSAEITFEANPDSISDNFLQRLRAEGFNRVSLGIQCADDAILKAIGRPHTFAQAVAAVDKIRRAGFTNLSVDLIYGLPGQDLNGWTQTLERVLSLHPEHISCYGLTLEKNTPLYQYQDNLPDDDAQAEMYMAAVELLGTRGFRQYEISNFARKGLYSRHNMKYWLGLEYLGFGPDASSDFAGKRYKIIRDLNGYIDGISKGGMVIDEVEDIPLRERAGEYIMLRLRTLNGISGPDYERRFLLPFGPIEEALEKQREYGNAMKADDGRWRLTPKGYLVSNAIISDLLNIQDTTQSLRRR